VLQTDLVRRWGTWTGILASNLLFTFGPLHADINARGIGMYHFQAEVFALDLAHHLAIANTGAMLLIGQERSTLNAALAVESRCEAIVPVATKADSSRVSGPYNRRAGAARAVNRRVAGPVHKCRSPLCSPNKGGSCTAIRRRFNALIVLHRWFGTRRSVVTDVPGQTRRELAGATGVERATSCVTGRRSNQLNYAPASYNRLIPSGSIRYPIVPWPFPLAVP
jgi:hypothetical protein